MAPVNKETAMNITPIRVSAPNLVEVIRHEFAGVDSDDLETDQADGLGSDDVPTISMQEITRGPAFLRMYGEWGCIRTLGWSTDPRRRSAEIAEYVEKFRAANHNEPVRVYVRPRFGAADQTARVYLRD